MESNDFAASPLLRPWFEASLPPNVLTEGGAVPLFPPAVCLHRSAKGAFQTVSHMTSLTCVLNPARGFSLPSA